MPEADAPATHDLALTWRDGHAATVRARADETVLDAAARADMHLPVGCLIGACSTCVGRVLAGRIEHHRPPRALKPAHLDAGYALLCVAEPRSDCRIEVGARVQADLVSTPRR